MRAEVTTSPAWLSDRAAPLRLAAAGGGKGDSEDFTAARRAALADDLPYMAELWDETRSFREQVVAVTAHASIGQAAFYAATRDYPERYITLRHQGRVIARYNAPEG